MSGAATWAVPGLFKSAVEFFSEYASFVLQWHKMMFFATVIHFMLGTSSSPSGSSVLGKTSLCFSILASHLAYLLLALITPHAFEICYASHALIYFLVALRFLKRSPKGQRLPVFKALLCCTGFVFFKRNDFHLAEVHMAFEIFSGHFISRLCDVYQFYHFFSVIELHYFDTESLDRTESNETLKID